MFGLDLLFDLDKDGKLDAFEQTAQLDFLDTVDNGMRSKKTDRNKSAYDFDADDDEDNDNGGRR